MAGFEALSEDLAALIRDPHEELDQILQHQSRFSPASGITTRFAPSSLSIASSGSKVPTQATKRLPPTFIDSTRVSTAPHQVAPSDSWTDEPAMGVPGGRQESNYLSNAGPIQQIPSSSVSLTTLLHMLDDAVPPQSPQSVAASAAAGRHLSPAAAPLMPQKPVHIRVFPTFNVPSQPDKRFTSDVAQQSSIGSLRRVRHSRFDPLASLKKFNLDPALYKVILRPDPAVDEFIASLRNRHDQGAGTSEVKRLEPVQLAPIAEAAAGGAESIAVNTVWHKAGAKELYLPVTGGRKRLFVVFSAQPRFLSHLGGGQSFLSVWEISPPQKDSVSSLYLYAFYPFTAEEYQRLGRLPEIGRDYGITVRHGAPNPGPTLKLKVTKMLPEEIRHQDAALQAHIQSSSVKFDLPSGSKVERQTPHVPVTRRSYYVYREDPSISPLLQSWKTRTGMSDDAFGQIHLTPGQEELLNSRMRHVFRSVKRVKVITVAGETLMICSHQRLSWLPETRRASVSLWKFGPLESAGHGRMYRVLYSVGWFWLSERNWRKLNSESVRGLKTSWFQYNRLSIPGETE